MPADGGGIDIRVDAGGQPGQQGRAQSGRLQHRGPGDGHIHDVRLKLHQKAVGAGATVHAQGLGPAARVLGHGGEQIGRLIGDGLKRRAHHMRRPGAPRHPDQGAPGVHIPVGRAKAGKRGHQVAVARGGHRTGQRFAVRRRLDQLHFVTQPLDGGAAHEHAALKGIGGLAVQPPGHRGQQPRLGQPELIADVHQHEAACAVGVFRHALIDAGLAKQRRVLVADQGGHGDRRAQNVLIQHADDAGSIHHRGQHLARDIHDIQQFVIPLLPRQVEQHRAARVGRVRHMGMALHQMPGQVAVHRAEAQLALPRPLAQVQVIQQPLQLGARKIGIRHQAGLFPDHVRVSRGLQLVHIAGRAAALPHDRPVHRPAAGFLP